MSMITFIADQHERSGYLAVPQGGKGRGVLLLHAWWGLTDFFKRTCDRIAAQGFVVFAPDLHLGKTAATIEEANHLVETADFPTVRATAAAALRTLQAHPAVQGSQVGSVGFSMGAFYALLLDSLYPEAFVGIVLFYGGSEMDTSNSKAQIQAHFGEDDDWEPEENVRQMAAANPQVYIYPNTYHWFVEEDRPAYYKPEIAALAWQRTLEFLDKTITR